MKKNIDISDDYLKRYSDKYTKDVAKLFVSNNLYDKYKSKHKINIFKDTNENIKIIDNSLVTSHINSNDKIQSKKKMILLNKLS